MTKVLTFFGITGTDGKIVLTNVVLYIALAKLCVFQTSVTDCVFIVAALGACVVEKILSPKAQTHETSNLDLTAIRSDVDKLKLALSVKEFKR